YASRTTDTDEAVAQSARWHNAAARFQHVAKTEKLQHRNRSQDREAHDQGRDPKEPFPCRTNLIDARRDDCECSAPPRFARWGLLWGALVPRHRRVRRFGKNIWTTRHQRSGFTITCLLFSLAWNAASARL